MRLLAKAVAVLASLNAAGAYEEAPAYAFDRLPADTPYQTFHTLGLEVAYLHDGGGTGFGLDLVRVVFNRFGRGAFKRCMEFCSGGGFIGFTLLALDVCETLVLADINQDNVQSVQETIRRNGLEGRVSVFLSDGFDGIPQSELGTWNLVVSNPPHFKSYFDVSPLHVVGPHTRGLVDLDWVLHRRFYAAVHRFLVPGAAHVIWQENKAGSRPADFIPMLSGTPLELVDIDSYAYIGVEGTTAQFEHEKMDYWYMHTTNAADYWASTLTYKRAVHPRSGAASQFTPVPACQLVWIYNPGESRFLGFSPECENDERRTS